MTPSSSCATNSRSLWVCVVCGRTGVRSFDKAGPEPYNRAAAQEWRCSNKQACRERERRAERNIEP